MAHIRLKDLIMEAPKGKQMELPLGKGTVDYNKKVDHAWDRRTRRFGGENPVAHSILGMVLGHQKEAKAWSSKKSRLWQKYIRMRPPEGLSGKKRNAWFEAKWDERNKIGDKIDAEYTKLAAERMAEEMTPEQIKYAFEKLGGDPAFKARVTRLLRAKKK